MKTSPKLIFKRQQNEGSNFKAKALLQNFASTLNTLIRVTTDVLHATPIELKSQTRRRLFSNSKHLVQTTLEAIETQSEIKLKLKRSAITR
ncbi:hypothetical protein [Paucibacter sp. B51]|uniref:hypothetical protein n=1 Tax=Paucibacter sp. B51 TaxID=2993315 RepID=UPI0022EBD0C0|nr:hypothetical protein [Paucibacter sp. B51]